MFGYEGLEKDSLEEFTQIIEDMDTNIKCMFHVLDEENGIEKYPALFLANYNDWQKCRKLILQNPYNDCGHKLASELIEAYNHIIETHKDELYYTF